MSPLRQIIISFYNNVANYSCPFNNSLTGVYNPMIFADVDNFITPSDTSSNRCTVVSGGYKKVGNLVYVLVIITPKSSASSFWTNGGGGGMLALPTVNVLSVPQMLNVAVINSRIIILNGKVRNDGLNNGVIDLFFPSGQTFTYSEQILIQGVYIAT